MRRNTDAGEDAGPEKNDDVKRRLKEIQLRHRGRIKWHLTQHTAELAIEAIEHTPRRKRPRRPPNGKSRRRKRWKRLL